MKILKNLLCFFIGFFVLSSSFSVNAMEFSSTEEKYGLISINNLNEERYEEIPTPRYGEVWKRTVLDTKYAVATVTPSGQNVGGTRFPNGGGFYVDPGSGSKASFSVDFGWGPVKFSVNEGKVSNVSGYYVQVPDKNNYYKVKIDKKVKIDRIKLDCYKAGQYSYSTYLTSVVVISEDIYCVKA